MRDILREKVTIAYPFGNITPEFHESMLRVAFFDLLHGKRLVRDGNNTNDAVIGLKSTHLAMARNKIVRAFLDECRSDWLVFIDTDQSFPPDIIERLIESADPVQRPIVSALIVAMRAENELSYACALVDGENLRVPATIPSERWWACIPGCGVVIIHRSVLAKMRDEYEGRTAFPWFSYPDRQMPDGTWDTLGEDYTFMLRAIACGFTPLVDTSIEVGHVKSVNLQPYMVPGRIDAYPSATVAVIPFKDKWKMTKATAAGADADLVLLLNNGSSPESTQAAVKYAADHDHVEVVDCKGLGIHEMWNAGAEVALERFPRVNIAFLNNDLALGDDCLSTLARELRSGPENLVAVCPNYDGRPQPDDIDGVEIAVEPLHGICANRYDGTGGLAGFCFMVKGEWFRSGYRFPEDCMWWFGDNDLTMSIDQVGGWYGMVHAATVVHLDGGGQTGDWSNYLDTPQGQADLAAFKAKWNLQEQAA